MVTSFTIYSISTATAVFEIVIMKAIKTLGNFLGVFLFTTYWFCLVPGLRQFVSEIKTGRKIVYRFRVVKQCWQRLCNLTTSDLKVQFSGLSHFPSFNYMLVKNLIGNNKA